jgi:hypothetical protein
MFRRHFVPPSSGYKSKLNVKKWYKYRERKDRGSYRNNGRQIAKNSTRLHGAQKTNFQYIGILNYMIGWFSAKAAAAHYRYSRPRAPRVSTSCTKRKQDCPPRLKWTCTVLITHTNTMIMRLTFLNSVILDLPLSLLAVISNFLNPLIHVKVKFESYITTDGQSVSLSWGQAPIWGPRPDFY